MAHKKFWKIPSLKNVPKIIHNFYKIILKTSTFKKVLKYFENMPKNFASFENVPKIFWKYCNIFGVSPDTRRKLSLNNENKAFPLRVTMEADVTIDLFSVTRM
jgi:hypothetical protein